ncbi:MAG: transcription antitermination factor NusB [Elusimicrobia bacterium]|nr:transcription antitermination factor NusB [Elusimicrobiota bacterium]
MGSRREGREICLQSLYLWDNCSITPEEAWITAISAPITNGDETQEKAKPKRRPMPDAETVEFAKTLWEGILGNREKIDGIIQNYCHNWKLDRMSAVDRNILRIGAFEIIGMPQIPINVTINEAVEIAKSYSTDESGRFVNGILDKIKQERKPA